MIRSRFLFPAKFALVGAFLLGVGAAKAQQVGLLLDLYQFPDSSFEGVAAGTFSNQGTYTSFFSGLTPTLETYTGADGVTDFNFSNVPNGNSGFTGVFGAFGFTSTANYVARMQGNIDIGTGGTYTFLTSSDDGSVIYIDNSLVVNNNRIQGTTTVSNTVNLSAGVHSIDIGYYQGGGGEDFGVFYSGPDSGSTTVPLPNTEVSTVPEPAAFAVFAGAGVLGLGWMRRRRGR